MSLPANTSAVYHTIGMVDACFHNGIARHEGRPADGGDYRAR
jgi:hypothetical protein